MGGAGAKQGSVAGRGENSCDQVPSYTGDSSWPREQKTYFGLPEIREAIVFFRASGALAADARRRTQHSRSIV